MLIKVTTQNDWLDAIAGRDVEHAIEYLRKLPPGAMLEYWQSSGDDQGVEISSGTVTHREETKKERTKRVHNAHVAKIQRLEASLRYWEDQYKWKMKAYPQGGSAIDHARNMVEKYTEELKLSTGKPIVK